MSSCVTVVALLVRSSCDLISCLSMSSICYLCECTFRMVAFPTRLRIHMYTSMVCGFGLSCIGCLVRRCYVLLRSFLLLTHF